ncbi:MAG TPA: hypothetical protein VNW46_05780 [Gemmatimonadaceae bacterium]|nr:hypothetical protein [Gemmatimonadaceae bacterium]
MIDVIRAYVNGAGVDVPRGVTAIEAVRAADPEVASGVERGDWVITDSRGLPTPSDTPVTAGAIFRLLPARRARGESLE